jgi:hypothetical protein
MQESAVAVGVSDLLVVWFPIGETSRVAMARILARSSAASTCVAAAIPVAQTVPPMTTDALTTY